MYKIVLLTHVVTAVIGIGQTFWIPLILLLPKSGSQLQFTQNLLHKMGKVAKISDFLLLITGSWMMYYINYNWDNGWLNISILLFITMRIFVWLYCGKYGKEIGEISVSNDEMPMDYSTKVRKFLYPLSFTQGIVFLILCLMVLKPELIFLGK